MQANSQTKERLLTHVYKTNKVVQIRHQILLNNSNGVHIVERRDCLARKGILDDSSIFKPPALQFAFTLFLLQFEQNTN